MFKKISLTVLIIALLSFGYYHLFATKTYYVYIDQTGQKHQTKDDKDGVYTYYTYQTTGYDKNGQATDLEFNSVKDDGTPLIKQNYFKITYKLSSQTVHSYEVLTKKEIPKDALQQLNNQKS